MDHSKGGWIRSEYQDKARGPLFIKVHFGATGLPGFTACLSRGARGRRRRDAGYHYHPREAHEALVAARARQARDEERRLYGQRAGIEGTLSQGVRAFEDYARRATAGWRRCICRMWVWLWYVTRLAAWLDGRSLAQRGRHASRALAA